MVTLRPDELSGFTGGEVGVSAWVEIGQERIDRFADITEDRQFIHTDPVRASTTHFGGTIAHGFLTLSMLSKFAEEAVPQIAGTAMGVNYGFNRIRNLAPVPSGSRIRGRFTLVSAEHRSATQLLITYQVVVEIDGVEKPALIAEWLVLLELIQSNQGEDA